MTEPSSYRLDPSLLDETIEVLTNLSQIINVCREEWKREGCWSDWDESICSQKLEVLAKLYALRDGLSVD
jgi:hypothetical protein